MRLTITRTQTGAGANRRFVLNCVLDQSQDEDALFASYNCLSPRGVLGDLADQAEVRIDGPSYVFRFADANAALTFEQRLRQECADAVAILHRAQTYGGTEAIDLTP